ncbi:hypothetical protein D3C86_1758530 [compost metagenome]
MKQLVQTEVRRFVGENQGILYLQRADKRRDQPGDRGVRRTQVQTLDMPLGPTLCRCFYRPCVAQQLPRQRHQFATGRRQPQSVALIIE